MDLPILEPVVAFIREHHEIAAFVVALLVLGESIAFISLVVPATAVLLAAGTLVGAGIIPLWEMMILGVLGCLVGDVISFWGGRRLGPHTHKVWPFNRHPQLLEQGERFFRDVGPWGVLIGRFFGPLRAVVPMSAGAMGMNFLPFLFMSALSAPLFLGVLLFPGAMVAMGLSKEGSGDLLQFLPAAIPVLITVGGGLFIAHRLRRGLGIKSEDELDRAS